MLDVRSLPLEGEPIARGGAYRSKEEPVARKEEPAARRKRKKQKGETKETKGQEKEADKI